MCFLGMNGEEMSGHTPGTHRYVCGRKGGSLITAGLEVEASSFRERVRLVGVGGDRQDKRRMMPKAWKQSFDLGCFNFLVISVAW